MNLDGIYELFRLFGEAFKEERTMMHITQKQMAQMLGCSESEYKAIEGGKPTVNAALFLKVCGSFSGTTVRELFENVGISFDVNHTKGRYGNKLTYFMNYYEVDGVALEKPVKKKKDDMLISLFEEEEYEYNDN